MPMIGATLVPLATTATSGELLTAAPIGYVATFVTGVLAGLALDVFREWLRRNRRWETYGAVLWPKVLEGYSDVLARAYDLELSINSLVVELSEDERKPKRGNSDQPSPIARRMGEAFAAALNLKAETNRARLYLSPGFWARSQELYSEAMTLWWEGKFSIDKQRDPLSIDAGRKLGQTVERLARRAQADTGIARLHVKLGATLAGRAPLDPVPGDETPVDWSTGDKLLKRILEMEKQQIELATAEDPASAPGPVATAPPA